MNLTDLTDQLKRLTEEKKKGTEFDIKMTGLVDLTFWMAHADDYDATYRVEFLAKMTGKAALTSQRSWHWGDEVDITDVMVEVVINHAKVWVFASVTDREEDILRAVREANAEQLK